MNPVPFSWMIIALLGIFVASGGGGFWYGYRYADRAADIANLNETIARQAATAQEFQRQSRANEKIAEDYKARVLSQIETENTLRQEVDAYAAELAAVPPSTAGVPPITACLLDRHDIDILRGLHNARAGNDHPAALPAGGPLDIRSSGSTPNHSRRR